jgi:hypothetical protein
MNYEIFVSHFLKDQRAVVTNHCNADIPLSGLFQTACWASYLRGGDVFRCSAQSPPQDIRLLLTSSNVFRRQIDCIPRGYSAAVTFDGSGIDVIHNLLAVRPEGAFVMLRASHP